MWETLVALLVGTAVSGVVPLVNAELLVIGAAAALPGSAVPLVAAVSTLGQMATKTVLFGVARKAPGKLPKKAQDRLDRASAALTARGGAAGSVVFTSAATGLPPFYGVSIASGALGMRLSAFLLCGTAGRALRFGVLAWAGHTFGSKAIDALVARGLPTFLLGGIG